MGLSNKQKVTEATESQALEVVPKPKRRKWTIREKRRIVAMANRCARGELGALMRREGIYSTQLAAWRKQLDVSGDNRQAQGMSGKRARENRQTATAESAKAEIARLRAENERQAAYVRQLELVLAIQKKAAALCTHVLSSDGKNS